MIEVAKDSPPGAVANVTVHAATTIRGEAIENDEPLALTINK